MIKTPNSFEVITKKKWHIWCSDSDSFLPSLSQLCFSWRSDTKTFYFQNLSWGSFHARMLRQFV